MENKGGLLEALAGHKVFSFSLFGLEVEVYNSIIVMWIIMAVLVLLSLLLVRNFKLVPAGAQNMVETVVDSINSFTRSMTGKHWMNISPFIGTMLLFLVLSNTISLFNFMPVWSELYEFTGIEMFKNLPQIFIRPPTKDINITMALAIVSTIFVIYYSIKFKRVSGWLKSFAEPSPILLPIKVSEYFIRALSLSFRLFGNILGAYIIMELVYIYVPVLLPAGFSVYFDIFDGVLQAFIFVFLTLLYIGEAVE